nr:hypothetical protein GCM10020241_11260 [Streptoalloteichus tenebrarius]
MLRREPLGYVLAVEPEQVDVCRFEALLREGRSLLLDGRHAEASRVLERCLALWRGSPYAEVGDYEPAGREATRLEELRLVAWESRCEAELAWGRDPATVAAELEALSARCPTRERLNALLMRALRHAGRPADALKVYDRTRRALARELGVDPGPELRGLFDAILRNEPVPPPASTSEVVAGTGSRPRARDHLRREGREGREEDVRSAAPVRSRLLERGDELAILEGHARAAREGRGRLVVVRGAAGVGKTRLLQEWERALADAGVDVEVVWGSCRRADGERRRPVWMEILRHLCRTRAPAVQEFRDRVRPELAALSAELWAEPPVPPAHGHAHDGAEGGSVPRHEVVCQLIQFLARRRPLVIILEDGRAADRPTRDLLDRLAPVLSTTPLLVVVTERSPAGPRADVAPSVRAPLPSGTAAEVIHLRPITTAALREFAAGVVGDELAEPIGSALGVLTGGHPADVGQLVEFLETVREPPPAAGIPGGGVPGGVREILRWWTGRLGPRTRDLLLACAVVGDDVDAAVIREVGGLGEDTLHHLDLAVASGLLVEDHHERCRYRFAHPRIRQVLYGDLNRVDRARLHARLGSFLAAHEVGVGADVERVAHHLWEARAVVDVEEALAQTSRAARHCAQRLDYERAETWTRRSLELARQLPPDDDAHARQVDLLDQLGHIAITGRGLSSAEAESAFAAALEICEKHRRAVPATVLMGLCTLYFTSGRLASAAGMAQMLLDQGCATGDTVALVGAAYAKGVVAYLRGEADVAVNELSWATGLVDRLHASSSGPRLMKVFHWSDPRVSCRSFEALARWLLDDREAMARVRPITMAESAPHTPVDRMAATYVDAVLAAFAGEADQALLAGAEGLRHASEHRSSFWQAMIRGPYGWAVARAGDVTRGLAHLRSSVEELRWHKAFLYLPLHLLYLADVQDRAGDRRGSRDSVRRALAEIHHHGLHVYLHPRFPFRELRERAQHVDLAAHLPENDTTGTAYTTGTTDRTGTAGTARTADAHATTDMVTTDTFTTDTFTTDMTATAGTDPASQLMRRSWLTQ